MKLSSKNLFISLTMTAVPFLGLPVLASAATQTVLIENIKFNPEHLEIHPGDTVVWQNKDVVPHTVTDEKNQFDSGGIQPGASWKKTFRKKSVFSYKCIYHPNMHASISVQK
jgi:plastocyanin